MSANSKNFNLLDENNNNNKISSEKQSFNSLILTIIKSLPPLTNQSTRQNMLDYINLCITTIQKQIISNIIDTVNLFVEKNEDVNDIGIIKNEIDDCAKKIYEFTTYFALISTNIIIDSIPVQVKTNFVTDIENKLQTSNMMDDIISELKIISNDPNKIKSVMYQNIINLYKPTPLATNNSEQLTDIVLANAIKTVSTINPEQLAQQLATKNIKLLGKSFDNMQNELILRVIITHIQTIILQLANQPKPINPSYIQLILMLLQLLNDEKTTIKLLSKVSDNKTFTELLSIEGFEKNPYDEVMNIVDTSIIETFENVNNKMSYTNIIIIGIVLILIIIGCVLSYKYLY